MSNKLIVSIISLCFFALSMSAQRTAIVDVSAVLENLPAYATAKAEVDKTSAKWRQDISMEYDKIKSMYNKYQAEMVLLSEEVKIEREDEIMEKEKSVRELQKRRFGPEGDLFRKRQELVSPIQDEVFKAIEDYAKVKGYDLIFDKAGAAGLLYANEEYDKTDEIKRELGIRK